MFGGLHMAALCEFCVERNEMFFITWFRSDCRKSCMTTGISVKSRFDGRISKEY